MKKLEDKMGRREKQTITSKDVGVLKLDKDGKISIETKKKCSICGEEYKIYDPENPRLNKKRKAARLPNEWSEEEEVAHRIGHVESVKSKRAIGTIINLSEADRREVLDFINEHYAG